METRYLTSAEEVELKVDPTQLAVRFHEPAPHTMRRRVALDTPALGHPVERYEIPGEKYTVFPVVAADGQDPAEALRIATESLERNPSVIRVASVFETGPNSSMMAPDRLMVGFRPGAVGPVRRLEEMGFEVADQFGAEYVVRLRGHDRPLEVASELAKLSEVAYAEPDFVEYGDVLELGPQEPVEADDPDAGSQWARGKTKADEAMDRLPGKKGNPAIRIAILDSGVDRQHLDLAASIAGIYDAADDPPKENPQDTDSHGTACAGLAAAIPFNEEGIRGFGGGCSILGVRIFYSSGTPRRWKLSSSSIVRGIEWAVCNHADVLSLSWYTVCPWRAVANAIGRALVHGRGGKGCVVVAGTGNDTRESLRGVKFPAWLPGVIAVAATDMSDAPVCVNPNGTGWGSAFGKEVALAAPGVVHATTDISGNKGDIPGDYMSSFQGTSAAAAVVAGSAGLVLSANPNLTGAEVRAILCSTAEKVHPDTFPYVNDHNEKLGAGRLNLLAAMEKVLGP